MLLTKGQPFQYSICDVLLLSLAVRWLVHVLCWAAAVASAMCLRLHAAWAQVRAGTRLHAVAVTVRISTHVSCKTGSV
jgi:hypothetical protein